MKKSIMFFGLTLMLSVSANAGEPQILNPTPEFSEIMKIYNNMTPEQRNEVVKTAQNVQAELAKKSPAERQEYWRKAKVAMKNIDFKNVDPSKLDTSKQVSLDQVDEYLSQNQSK
jgi:acyl-CoA reductase-like NAD-dependent aldehyde dehydrogenase